MSSNLDDAKLQNLIVGIFGIGNKRISFGCFGAHIGEEPANNENHKSVSHAVESDFHRAMQTQDTQKQKAHQMTGGGALCKQASS